MPFTPGCPSIPFFPWKNNRQEQQQHFTFSPHITVSISKNCTLQNNYVFNLKNSIVSLEVQLDITYF